MPEAWPHLSAWILLFSAAPVVLATALPFIRRGYWWLRIFDFPRLQIAGYGVIVLCVASVLLPFDAMQIVLLTALLCSISVQAWRIYPYTALAPQQVQWASEGSRGTNLSIVVANVLMSNRQGETLLKTLEAVDPDLLFLIETDGWWADKVSTYAERYPFRIEKPQDNTYGMLLYSRFALEEPRCRYIVEPEVPSFHTRVLLPSGDPIELYALHPRPPQPAQDTFERDAELLIVGREIRDKGRPAVVIGDLNDVAWSSTTRLFQRTSGLLDPRIGRGIFSTYHAKIPLFRWPLDHVFVSAAFQLIGMKRLKRFGSDHFPILVELTFRPDEPQANQKPTPRIGDAIEVKQRIDEGTA